VGTSSSAITCSYVRELAQALQEEQVQLAEEIDRLLGNVAHIDNVVGVQQTYARSDALHG
jgi:hypothetical protein